MTNTFKPLATSLAIAALSACAQPQPYVPLVNIPARQQESNRITLGTVQMYVKQGASSTEIISALGSPNVITTDSSGKESWVYDKVSQEAELARNDYQAVATRTSRTLTVVIRFDEKKRVASFATHSSSF
jgi:outer membrane protein assembly factor BamE (lipoprotein component of BamABCDE complex)